MAKMIHICCARCDQVACVPFGTPEEARMGLYMAHLIGEHWDELKDMKEALGPVEPGAWTRVMAIEL